MQEARTLQDLKDASYYSSEIHGSRGLIGMSNIDTITKQNMFAREATGSIFEANAHRNQSLISFSTAAGRANDVSRENSLLKFSSKNHSKVMDIDKATNNNYLGDDLKHMHPQYIGEHFQELEKMRQLRQSFEYLAGISNDQNDLINRGKTPKGF